METKQKTWEDCCNQIAKDNGWDNWESVLISKMSLESKSILTYKAAELFNSYTAEERDRLKSEFDKSFILGCQLTKENNDLKEENERLKKHSNKLLEAQSQWQFFAEGYGNGSASISEVNHAAIELESASVNLKSLLSKSSDGYTKAKD